MSRIRPQEDGATVVLIAAAMIVFLGFAAIAVDLGLGYNQKRLDQNGSDFGAMAAVQFANTSTTGGCAQANLETRAACNGAVAAMLIVDQNLVTAPNWAQANCDPGRPAEFVHVAPNTGCVSFNDSFDRARVMTPIVPVGTAFARALGITQIDTEAEAEAGGSSRLENAVLPFGIPAAFAGTSYECIRTGANPSFGVCDGGAVTGNFGSLDISVYGTEEWVQLGGSFVPTNERCSGADTTRLAWNIAAGVDHPLSSYTSGTPVNDRLSCPIFNARPNEILGQPGIGNTLETGLFDGSSAYSADGSNFPGRLSRGGNQVEIKNGVWADDTPLWTYLIPGSCGAPVSNQAEMQTCLDNWVNGVIFRPALGNAVRYGFAPELTTNFSSGASQDYLIQRFRPVYLDRTYFRCTGGGNPTCRIVHSPGELQPGNATPTDPCPNTPIGTCGLRSVNQSIAALTSYMLQPGMVPASIRDPGPGSADQAAYNLTK